MGLVPGFVLSVNRRALLAVLAVGISVSYALVAGAAVGGLEEAQSTLAGDLAETDLVVTHPDASTFDPNELEPRPDRALATTETDAGTVYTLRHGDERFANASLTYADPSGPWPEGANVSIAGENRTITHRDAPGGADRDWLGVNATVFEAAGGPAEGADLAVYEGAADWLAQDLREQGFEVERAPATFPFYTAGSLELVSAVSVTVVASALVVALLTSTIVSLELQAKRSSFATLQVYAGSGLVRRLVAGRGLAILAGGHAIGLAATFGLLFVLGRAGAVELALPAGYLATALGATFGGGVLGLALPTWRAGRPLRADELGQATSSWNLPSPLRFTLTSWRTVVPLAISAMILAGSLGVVYGAVDMPTQLFGTDDAQVLADTSGNPLRGSVPAFAGFHLGGVDGFEGSSPEIFAPTTIQGEPVMVRGVAWPQLTSMDQVRLVEGRAVERAGEAVLGTRLARALDADVGDAYRLPAAYTTHAETVRVVGIAKAPGLLGDEVLVSLETARDLNPMPEDHVTMVRYSTTDDRAERGLAELPAGVEATGLGVRPERPVPRQEASARVDLVNFAEDTRGRQLTLQVDGEPVADRWVEVPGRSTATTHLTFRVPAGGLVDLQVNPERTVETSDPAYAIEVPDVVVNDTTTEVTVTRTGDGEPAADVRVELGDTRVRTDSEGRAQLRVTGVGNRTIAAEGPAGHGARTLVVVDPADQHRSRLVYPEIHGPRQIDEGPWSGAAIVENVGGEAFEGVAEIPVDGEPRNTSYVRLLAGQRDRVSFELALDEGRHTIGEGSSAITVTVGRPSADDGGGGSANGSEAGSDDGGTGGDGEGGSTPSEDASPRELLQARAEQGAGGSGQDEEAGALDAFLADTFENFDAAVTLVTIATVLHAGLIGLVSVRRDVEENADNLATMATVGADRSDLRRRALREFAVVGGLATAIGVAAGLAIVGFAAERGWIRGFGHALVPRTDLGFALRVAAVAMLVVLASVVIAVEQVRGRSIGSLLSSGPRRSSRPPLSKLIGGEP